MLCSLSPPLRTLMYACPPPPLLCVCVSVYLCLCSERNFLGLNQKLSALVELGQSDSLFRLQWVDPWIHGDPNRTSRTLSVMNTRYEGGRGGGGVRCACVNEYAV